MAPKEREKIILFQGEKSEFSNMFRRPVDMGDHGTFSTSEHAFQILMLSQAGVPSFRLREIYSEDNPFRVKRLAGDLKRELGLYHSVSKQDQLQLMRRIVRAKFTQHPSLRLNLICSDPCVLAEATPDRFWGIGFYKENPCALKPSTWGQNQLGHILMDLRRELVNANKPYTYVPKPKTKVAESSGRRTYSHVVDPPKPEASSLSEFPQLKEGDSSPSAVPCGMDFALAVAIPQSVPSTSTSTSASSRMQRYSTAGIKRRVSSEFSFPARDIRLCTGKVSVSSTTSSSSFTSRSLSSSVTSSFSATSTSSSTTSAPLSSATSASLSSVTSSSSTTSSPSVTSLSSATCSVSSSSTHRPIPSPCVGRPQSGRRAVSVSSDLSVTLVQKSSGLPPSSTLGAPPQDDSSAENWDLEDTGLSFKLGYDRVIPSSEYKTEMVSEIPPEVPGGEEENSSSEFNTLDDALSGANYRRFASKTLSKTVANERNRKRILDLKAKRQAQGNKVRRQKRSPATVCLYSTESADLDPSTESNVTSVPSSDSLPLATVKVLSSDTPLLPIPEENFDSPMDFESELNSNAPVLDPSSSHSETPIGLASDSSDALLDSKSISPSETPLDFVSDLKQTPSTFIDFVSGNTADLPPYTPIDFISGTTADYLTRSPQTKLDFIFGSTGKSELDFVSGNTAISTSTDLDKPADLDFLASYKSQGIDFVFGDSTCPEDEKFYQSKFYNNHPNSNLEDMPPLEDSSTLTTEIDYSDMPPLVDVQESQKSGLEDPGSQDIVGESADSQPVGSSEWKQNCHGQFVKVKSENRVYLVSNCPVCDVPCDSSRCHSKGHLPWFTNPELCCWECPLGPASRMSYGKLQRHLREIHPRGRFGPQHAAKLALLKLGALHFLKDYFKCKTLFDLLVLAKRKKFEIKPLYNNELKENGTEHLIRSTICSLFGISYKKFSLHPVSHALALLQYRWLLRLLSYVDPETRERFRNLSTMRTYDGRIVTDFPTLPSW